MVRECEGFVCIEFLPFGDGVGDAFEYDLDLVFFLLISNGEAKSDSGLHIRGV